VIQSTVEILSKLISYPSVSRDPIIDLAGELATMCEDIGFHVHLFQTSETKQNVLAHIGPINEHGIALSGHMDVVPVDGQSWDSDPFKAAIDNDRLIGRGSCDMKGFIAIALKVLSEMDFSKLRRGITLAWTHDEEVGCIGAQALQTQLSNSNIGLPKAMLIGEPTSLDICHYHGGHSTIEIDIRGRAAHSSKPELGLNANDWLYRCLHEVGRWKEWLTTQVCNIASSPPILNVAQISGGEAINIVAGQAQIRLGLRPMPSHNCNKLIDRLRKALQPLQEDIHKRGGLITIKLPQHAPPMFTPLPCSLEQSIHEIHSKAEIIGVPFATDGGCFAESGCSPLIWGPGSIDVAHQPNEWVSINELKEYQQMLSKLLRNWCC